MEHSVSLGLSTHSVAPKECWLSPYERARHLYVIGRTGSGKTTFLRNIALQDIHAGHGLCLIDPHGDIAEALADSIPKNRINDVIYWDVADRERPIAFNPLDMVTSVDEADLAASELVTATKALFGNSWGEWLEYLLKNTVLALAFRPGGTTTIVAVQRMLEDKHYRKRVLGELRDPVVQSFWENWFQKLREAEELQRTSSTLNKIGKFSMSPVVRNIVGQWKSGFDVQRVMDERKVLIVNLSKGQIGADNANFLGALLTSKIVSTALRRSNIPESERVRFNLIIDEFQNITSTSFKTIVSEARKYALSLVIAHQNTDQIDGEVLRQITKDVGTLAVFRVAFGDSTLFQSAFHPLRKEYLEHVHDGEFWLRDLESRQTRIKGYPPDVLDYFRTGSLEKVRQNSRWRHSRPRESVERDFGRWYGEGRSSKREKMTTDEYFV